VRAVNWMRPHYVQDHRRIVVRRGGHRSGVHRACMLSRPEMNRSSMPRTLDSEAGCDWRNYPRCGRPRPWVIAVRIPIIPMPRWNLRALVLGARSAHVGSGLGRIITGGIHG
jgi:hypothetical protein